MKRNYYQIILIICILIFSECSNAQDPNPCKTGGQTCYFGVEINNVLCGYSVETYCDGFLNGKAVRFEYSDVTLKMTALGAEVDAGFRLKYAIDPATRRAIEVKADIINGGSVVTTLTKFANDTIYFSSPASGVTKTIYADSGVIFSTQTWYPHLYNDFIRNNITEKKYKVFDPLRGEITEKEYSRKPEERIVLSDSVFQTMVLEEKDISTGIMTTLWLNKADGYNVKAVIAGRRNIYLADKSVISRINFANIDNELFIKADRKIPEIMNLTSLRVKAKINSYGESLTVSSLNTPGQKFEGTVSGSLIDGVFVIEPVRYSGENAPPFHQDFSKSQELKKYLGSELMIESDNPLIINEAGRITSGSKDSWEASIRLGKWVAENIAGAIPGGISAINTLKTGEAECGGHSRLLTAFCRAVGIPSRIAVGCMYTNYHSGGFGQHAWTEVYMGDAGWIPIDATVYETDYIDAGHIRLGENATFRPLMMEILDFSYRSDNSGNLIPDNLKPFPGNYMNTEQYRMFKIVFKNDHLALDIPGRILLDLNLPDEKGDLYPVMTREISLRPGIVSNGKVDKMIMHQYLRLKKMSPSGTNQNEVPDDFRRFTGNYQFTPARLSLDVLFEDGSLTTQEPSGNSEKRISYSRTGDTWTDKSGKYEISFISGSENEITNMLLTVKTQFVRGEPVTNAVEIVIKDSGIDAGLKKYDEIKKSGNRYYLFSEHMLHQLGHNLLKENRIDDAIMIFRKNVFEYPESFMANDALAETYLKKGENKHALEYFETAVKLKPDYEYGRNMIQKLRNQ